MEKLRKVISRFHGTSTAIVSIGIQEFFSIEITTQSEDENNGFERYSQRGFQPRPEYHPSEAITL